MSEYSFKAIKAIMDFKPIFDKVLAELLCLSEKHGFTKSYYDVFHGYSNMISDDIVEIKKHYNKCYLVLYEMMVATHCHGCGKKCKVIFDGHENTHCSFDCWANDHRLKCFFGTYQCDHDYHWCRHEY